MSTKFYISKYKGVESVVLENNHFRAQWLPHYGSKLASFIVKNQEEGHELLFQSSLDNLILPKYGDIFSCYESSGFDECFPSIDACEINYFKVPDHGEVWAMPWEYDVLENNKIQFSIVSERFNYRLTKIIELDEQGLKSHYFVASLSSSDLPFIWTPHALFRSTKNTQFIIPSHMNRIINVGSNSTILGGYGTLHNYPLPMNLPPLDFSALEQGGEKTCEKFYFIEKLKPEDKFGFMDQKVKVLMEVDECVIPYLGIWKNQGAYKGHYNFALEPCSGIYDNTQQAAELQHCSILKAGKTQGWHFNIIIERVGF